MKKPTVQMFREALADLLRYAIEEHDDIGMMHLDEVNLYAYIAWRPSAHVWSASNDNVHVMRHPDWI